MYLFITSKAKTTPFFRVKNKSLLFYGPPSDKTARESRKNDVRPSPMNALYVHITDSDCSIGVSGFQAIKLVSCPVNTLSPYPSESLTSFSPRSSSLGPIGQFWMRVLTCTQSKTFGSKLKVKINKLSKFARTKKSTFRSKGHFQNKAWQSCQNRELRERTQIANISLVRAEASPRF